MNRYPVLITAGVLATVVLATGAGFGTYRIFLVPTQAVWVVLEPGTDPQVVAQHIEGPDGVAYHVFWCGGAGPGPELVRRAERTYLINIKRGHEAEALGRAEHTAGVQQAGLEPIPGPCRNDVA